MTGKGLILVVDDTAESLELLTELLTAEDYEVHPADSGALALASVAVSKPELILLDIRMSGMDGLEVCRRLKARKESRDIPVIYISAITDSKERAEGLKLGAVDFVSKPFQKEELVARVETHLELSRLRLRLEQRVAERTAKLKVANEQLQVELAERLRAERALSESEERFRTMADSAPVVIWTSGPDTKMNINFCNKYALTFTGKTMEELTGDRWKDLVHSEDLELKFPHYRSIIAARRDYRVEYRLRRDDGEYRWMLDTATPRFLPNGNFAGYIGIAIDISDLKLSQQQWLATQKLESLGTLVAGIAHSFNNLLGTILAETDLALTDICSDSPAHGNVERINAVAIRASNIVKRLMTYAGARGIDAFAPVNLSNIVEETIQLFSEAISKNITLSLSLPRMVPAILADASQMRQVVLNLLTNASESLENQAGIIRVCTSPVCTSRPGAAKNWPNLPEGDYVSLEVADTGCGISAEAQSRIFDPFYTTKSLGRGLGLAAVHGIVRGHGGAVRVRSALGKGSTFEVLFPCFDALRVPLPDWFTRTER